MALASIIEEVTRAEQEAEQIRQKAEIAGREAIAAAQAKVKEKLEEYQSSERNRRRENLERAQQEGEKLAQTIHRERMDQIEAQCADAREKVPDAVAYLLGRIVETV